MKTLEDIIKDLNSSKLDLFMLDMQDEQLELHYFIKKLKGEKPTERIRNNRHQINIGSGNSSINAIQNISK